VKKQSQGIIIVLKHFFLNWIFANCLFFHLIIWVRFSYVHLPAQIFILNNLFCLFIFLWYFTFFTFFLSILMVIISLELTRVNPDRNIFSINVELTYTFLLYRGLVHHHHRILNSFINGFSSNVTCPFLLKENILKLSELNTLKLKIR